MYILSIRLRFIIILGCLLGSSLSAVKPCAEETAYVLDGQLELFVDQHMIEDLSGTDLRLHHPRPAGKAIAFDQPWEGKYSGYVTVLRDEDSFHMYYRGVPSAGEDGSEAEVTCYAESSDGITWSKPSLGLFEVMDAEGKPTRDNNVILAGAAPFSHNFAPFIDRKPECDPAEKLKAVAGTVQSGLFAFVSEDGKRWRKLDEKPILTDGAFDSQNVAFWSESEGMYVCYIRTWNAGGFEGVRSVSRSTSEDFTTWSEPVQMDFGDTEPEHIYTNQTDAYYRAPHIYIATAARFMPGRRVLSAEKAAVLGGDAQYSGDISDTVLMSSRGGNTYDRTFMDGFVRPGLGDSNWTSRTNYPARGVVPTGEGAMSMYVQRNYGQPTHFLERLDLRVDGFASVHAGYEGGTFMTKPMILKGEKLMINYSTSAAGSIRVGISEVGNLEAFQGFSTEDADVIIGDEIERVVSWKGEESLAALENRPVRLVFQIKDADLYSIRCE